MSYPEEALNTEVNFEGLEIEKKKKPKASKPVVAVIANEANEAPLAQVLDIVGELKVLIAERDKLRVETAKLKAWLKEVQEHNKQVADILNKGGSLIRS